MKRQFSKNENAGFVFLETKIAIIIGKLPVFQKNRKKIAKYSNFVVSG